MSKVNVNIKQKIHCEIWAIGEDNENMEDMATKLKESGYEILKIDRINKQIKVLNTGEK